MLSLIICTTPPIPQIAHELLIPSGYLILKATEADLLSANWRQGMGELIAVDLIIQPPSTYLLVLQKPPLKARDTWRDHSFPDLYPGNTIALLERLIKAVTNSGDIVGGNSKKLEELCYRLNRKFHNMV